VPFPASQATDAWGAYETATAAAILISHSPRAWLTGVGRLPARGGAGVPLALTAVRTRHSSGEYRQRRVCWNEESATEEGRSTAAGAHADGGPPRGQATGLLDTPRHPGGQASGDVGAKTRRAEEQTSTLARWRDGTG
jgi:hypothetical protein